MEQARFYITLLLALLCQLPGAVAQSPNVQTVDAIQFTLASELSIERAVPESLVKWPVVADWDYAGRLVVVESGGVAKPIEEHNKQLLHRIIRLIDEDDDGQFDRRIIAADKLPFPEGVLCLGDDMLVSAPPNIWKLTDADGDGVCEAREVWFDGQTITGCANDLHGPYLGRDGWIYWCKGAFAEQSHQLLNGQQLVDSAAHIYRRKFSGGAIEPVMSGGMDNPVEVAFTPEGERYFTSTFLQHPGDGLRDGIAHAVYGGVYGKDHHVIHGLTRTGPLMPIMTQLGPAAPSGLTCLESSQLLTHEQLGADSSTAMPRTLVAALFNLQKVTAHRLSPSHGTFQTEDVDLLVADRIDFHPTDILEDADGSLLVVDTGGWYDLCCPTSRVDQHTAAGGIYRLRRNKNNTTANAKRVMPATIVWKAASVQECVQAIHDSRPWVARMASLRLSVLGEQAIDGLTAELQNLELPIDHRLRALWALSSVGTDNALAAIALTLTEQHPRLIQAACHAISVHRYRPAKQQLEELVKNPGRFSDEPRQVLRAGAEALGRIGDNSSIPALMDHLKLASAQPVVLHSLRYAMLEIGEPTAIAPFLDSQFASQRSEAMFLLDKLNARNLLTQERVAQGLSAPREAERMIAIDILSRHPEWLDAVLPMINKSPDPSLLQLYRAWRDQPQFQTLVAKWINDLTAEDAEPVKRSEINQLLAVWDGSELPVSFIEPLAAWLQQSPGTFPIDVVSAADLSSAHSRPLVKAIKNRIETTDDPNERLRVLRCLPTDHSLVAPEMANEQLASFVHPESDSRLAAGDALRRIKIDESHAQQIVEAIATFAPRELVTALELVSSVKNDAVDRQLLARLESTPTARTLPIGFIEGLYRDRNEDLRKLADATSKQLNAPTADIAKQVVQWLEQLPEGDAVRGLQVFRSAKASCSACHQLGYVGGRIGPELSRIGASRTREALLEAILFPSSRIEQSYQPLKILTHDGQVLNGLVKAQDETALELQLTADKSIVVQRTDVEQQSISVISVMPASMQEILTKQELADLLKLLELSR